MKAGKVMRLKRPKTRRKPSIPDAKMDECSCSLSAPNALLTGYIPHLIFQDPLDQDHAPQYHQRLNRVREGMCLVGPSDIGGSHQYHSHSSLPGRMYQLMDCPVFKDKAPQKHHSS